MSQLFVATLNAASTKSQHSPRNRLTSSTFSRFLFLQRVATPYTIAPRSSRELTQSSPGQTSGLSNNVVTLVATLNAASTNASTPQEPFQFVEPSHASFFYKELQRPTRSHPARGRELFQSSARKTSSGPSNNVATHCTPLNAASTKASTLQETAITSSSLLTLLFLHRVSNALPHDRTRPRV